MRKIITVEWVTYALSILQENVDDFEITHKKCNNTCIGYLLKFKKDLEKLK